MSKKKQQPPKKNTPPSPPPLWAGRLEQKPKAEAFAFQASIGVDQRLALVDIEGSRAHVAMLGKQKIIPAGVAAQIGKELERIGRELETGKLIIDNSAEDIHSFIEGVLTERIGDAGRMLHAGRSRNDQVATDFRLYLKRAVPELQRELAVTIRALLDKAEQHAASIMPGYTHLQRAQPVTLGHHLIAWCAGLWRDHARLSGALARITEECPLGSGALAGSSLPLDRKAVAEALGFNRPSLNSMDAVADRDFALELSAACAITMTHLSRFCEDIVLWASAEFGFIDLAEAWSTGSSIMPQKKNPDFAELIRGKAGRTTGNLVTLLTLLKGLPYAYDKDLQEDKESLFDSIDTLRACLRMFTGMMASAEFNVKKMKSAGGGFMEATDAADYLVRKGMPFRIAHETVALIVRDCIATHQRHIGDLSLAELKKRSKLFEEDIYPALKPAACVRARDLPGGPAPKEVKRQIRALRKKIGM